MPNLAIQPAYVPVDAPFPPASAQAMLNFVAAYLQVSGLENLQGVIKSATSPAAEDQDKAWLRLDPTSNRPIGIYVFNGEWTAVPLVVPSGDAAPVNPRKGELYFDPQFGLQIYDGSQWTANLFPTGVTADRPKNAPLHSLYFDTDIGRLLKYTTRGWSTFEGAVGDLKFVDDQDVETALTNNPGWFEYSPMAGKFLMGSSSTYGPTSSGGSESVAWSAKGRSASGGTREASASFINTLSIDGTEVTADMKKMDGTTDVGSGSFKILPPYKALIFLRKDY